MTTTTLELTALDPIVARDGRPFGVGQGNRMRGLGWPYPSVVAGSLRTALVKSTPGRDFAGTTPQELLAVSVAGVLPVARGTLYLPAPNDCVLEESEPNGSLVHRTIPADFRADEGCDWPGGASLKPVLLGTDRGFKPKDGPAWWPAERIAAWITGSLIAFDNTFLGGPEREIRDHVQLDPETGTAAENRLFATAGLALTHLPRFGAKNAAPFPDRYVPITLSVRVEAEGWAADAARGMNTLHPLGGERRVAHWLASDALKLWRPPSAVEKALAGSNQKVRMTLATPAVFTGGWRPGWIDPATLSGRPPWWLDGPELTLVAVNIQRWRAVSGWSLAEPRGPKPVKRLVPAGGVYFFETRGDVSPLVGQWLQPVSDALQDRRDGFGLAVWGTW